MEMEKEKIKVWRRTDRMMNKVWRRTTVAVGEAIQIRIELEEKRQESTPETKARSPLHETNG